jgi:hypothetical protein
LNKEDIIKAVIKTRPSLKDWEIAKIVKVSVALVTQIRKQP